MFPFIEIKNISLKDLPKNRLIIFLVGFTIGILLIVQIDIGGNKNTANVSQSLQFAELSSLPSDKTENISCISGKFPDNVDD